MNSQANLHVKTLSADGSFTAFSTQFNEHYHSTKDGALNESLQKHVIPAIKILEDKKSIIILDICFGLGFNTLATLYYIKKNNLDIKVIIYSPEFDRKLINSLNNFEYPIEFYDFRNIIKELSSNYTYKDENIDINIIVGDAREYLKVCDTKFDIVFQDAFSPDSNPLLWTQEYFEDINRVIKDDGIITTYSIALKTRLALHNLGFKIYLNRGEKFRSSTIASKIELKYFDIVDMKHKISCNQNVVPLSDREFLFTI
ncbi:MAG: hypothetical protein GQ570_02850 [Helicobacteraceae bacterium]|nr:hypothetical protein [Helicobacteraceae bacterium]